MENNLKELEIAFNKNNDVYIDIKSPSKVVFLDIALLSHYIIRWSSILFGVPQLSTALRNASSISLEEFNIGDYFEPSNKNFFVPKIVKKKSNITKSFTTSMFGFEHQNYHLFGIVLNFHGFNFVGNDLKYYGIQSINALIRHYALYYKDNMDVQNKLQYALDHLGYLCADEEVIASGNIIRQGQEVIKLLHEIFGRSPY